MSEFTLTEQSVDPPKPGTDDGKKTVTVFGKDSTATPGTTIPASIDSDNNVGDFKGDQGDQGVIGPPGPTGPPGTLSVQIVVNISNPTELEALTLLAVGSDIIAHQVIGAGASDLVTMYLYDDDGPAKNAPFVMNTGDGGTTRWIATSGRFFNSNITMADGRTVDGRDISVDGTKLDGIDSGAEVNNAATALTDADNNFSTKQTFQNNVVVEGQGFSENNTLIDAATIATDCNNGNVHTVTLGDNRTLGAPTNLKNGSTYIWIIKQDGTGSRTLAYNAVFKFEGGLAPILSIGANSIDILSAVSDGTNVLAQLIRDFR